MSRKSVLILCDIFPPAFGPRMGYLCKYLRLNGWNPVVVTEYIDENTFAFLAKDVDVSYLRYYKKKGFAGKIEWGITLLCDVMFGCKDRRLYREALKLSGKHPFDLILCSTYRTFPLPAAGRLARKTGLPLVVDLRDIIEQYTGDEFIAHKLPEIFGLRQMIASAFRKRNLAIRNKILSGAACVTTVSPWHVSLLREYNKNTYLIYNGFDPEIFYPVSITADKFYITYTGRLLSVAMRNPELLFHAVERLAGEKVIAPDLFRLRWFVDDKSRRIIEAEVLKYPVVAAFMDYPGYVPAAEIPRKLNESAILLLLTNKAGAGGPKGVMTTKFFESIAVGKSVLCVRGDEDCLEDVIRRTRSGLSAHNADEVYGFIKKHYLCWLEGKPCEDNFDKDEIKKFSRQEQARWFIEIFEQAMRLIKT